MDQKPIKVLLIEDDQDQILMYKTKFTMEGIPILATQEGSKGIEMAKQEMPDVILLDVIMYEMSGVEVLKKLKEDPATKEIPVIMLTNLSKVETQKECMKLGALDYLIKTDIEPHQLVDRIRSLPRK